MLKDIKDIDSNSIKNRERQYIRMVENLKDVVQKQEYEIVKQYHKIKELEGLLKEQELTMLKIMNK